jgi:hypothetical protein
VGILHQVSHHPAGYCIIDKEWGLIVASSSMLGAASVDATNVAMPIAVWNGADSVLQIPLRDESKDHIAIFLILSHLSI